MHNSIKAKATKKRPLPTAMWRSEFVDMARRCQHGISTIGRWTYGLATALRNANRMLGHQLNPNSWLCAVLVGIRSPSLTSTGFFRFPPDPSLSPPCADYRNVRWGAELPQQRRAGAIFSKPQTRESGRRWRRRDAWCRRSGDQVVRSGNPRCRTSRTRTRAPGRAAGRWVKWEGWFIQYCLSIVLFLWFWIGFLFYVVGRFASFLFGLRRIGKLDAFPPFWWLFAARKLVWSKTSFCLFLQFNVTVSTAPR